MITANEYTDIHSILISKDGILCYEQYFNGWARDSLHDLRSSFKSITSLLMGIAIDKGFIQNVHQKVYSFFPGYIDFTAGDSLKKNMTIKDLLNMQSGFDCEEFNDGKDCETDMVATKDWLKFSLHLPMKNPPGKVWAYTSCDPMIVGGIISQAAKMPVMEFAEKYLFHAMGITNYRWTVDPSGHGMTAGSFYMRPADMLKIGMLVAQNGIWEDHRIVSESWLNASRQTLIPIPGFSFMKSSRSPVATAQQTYYGYYWYTENIKTPTYGEEIQLASGNGGQYIMIIKRLNLVVVFTQGNYNSWKAKRAFDLLARYILPAYDNVHQISVRITH
ncbi:serine hydrolase domain-containing protein [Chitinophaga polysaccharea]|uniref:serine hydrolase domain-containing protein n=1 Tax=Chitinophaga polysaccharea TaxID=1293035 RepID=UPI0016497588|nr:serine hydrolase [Chitinophaga polysaccharea]